MRERKRWTPEEDERLAALAGYLPMGEIAARLGRSYGAVRTRRARLELGPESGMRTPAERGLHLAAVARILGVERMAVYRLIRAGALEGHRSPDRKARGFVWHIHPAALATFLRERPERYDARRITDPRWRAIATAPRRRPSLAGDRLLSVREVAPRVYLSPWGVTAALRRGDLQGVLCRNRTGTAWWVLESSVRAYQPPPLDWGHRGVEPATAARRARVLAEREALQARIDAGAPAIVAKKRAA